MGNTIKNPNQIANIRESGKYLTELLQKLKDTAKAGISLIELEFVAEDYIKKRSLKGAFKGYEGFPANLCLSVNDCVVHGIPDDTLLKNGDLLKIDCGIIYQKGYSDAAVSLVIGGEMANPLGHKLAKVTKDALDFAIQTIAPGKFVYEYSHAVHEYIQQQGFSILKKLTGHGVGSAVHEEPHIYNRPHPDTKNMKFTSGMVLAFEPITAIESTDFHSKPGNAWNLYTNKADLGAQREYTIVITNDGYEILAGVTEF